MNYSYINKALLFFVMGSFGHTEIQASQPNPRPTKKIKALNTQQLFECPYDNCTKALTTKKGIKLHIEAIHKGIRVLCTYPGCNQTFSHNSNMNQHVREIHNRKGIPCAHSGCTETFFQNNTMNQHVKTIHRKKRVPCTHPGCDKTFSHNSNMNRHIKEVHWGTKRKHASEQSSDQLSVDIAITIASLSSARDDNKNAPTTMLDLFPFTQVQ